MMSLFQPHLHRWQPATQLRVVFACMALATAARTYYSWTGRSTATDFAWVYRIGFPVIAASFAWGAWRPRVAGMTAYFWPLATLALIRVADFIQDWFITPTTIDGRRAEQLDLLDRLTVGAYGWTMAVLLILLIHVLEDQIYARLHDRNDTNGKNGP